MVTKMKNKKISNLKLENKTVGLRKKLGIIAVIFLLIFAAGVTSATIRLKDPSGVTSGYWGDESVIKASNDQSWTITCDNLQTAIYSMNNESGIITVGSDISLSSGIIGARNLTLDFQGHTITPSSSFNIITMKPGMKLKNLMVDCTVTNLEDAVVLVDGVDAYELDTMQTVIENVVCISHDKQGTLIYIISETGSEHVAFLDVIDVKARGMTYGVHINVTNSGAGTSWVNGNRFTRCTFDTCNYPMYLNMSGGGTKQIVGNMFTDFFFINSF